MNEIAKVIICENEVEEQEFLNNMRKNNYEIAKFKNGVNKSVKKYYMIKDSLVFELEKVHAQHSVYNKIEYKKFKNMKDYSMKVNKFQDIINLTIKLKEKLKSNEVIKDIIKSDSLLHKELSSLYEEIENLLSLGI